MTRFALAVLTLGLALPLLAAPMTEKEALQEFNEFVGKWSGSGGPAIGRGKPSDIWKETLNWGWKFSKGDSWLAFDITDGKYFEKGELRYSPKDKEYSLKVTDPEGKERTFTGEFSRGFLTLFHQDPTTKDKERLQLSTNNEGARMVYEYALQKGGRGIYRRLSRVSHTKEGKTLASSGSKKECVVTGGLGTMAVSYKGKTYYVCCSGCAEAFRDDPEKIIAEYEKRKK